MENKSSQRRPVQLQFIIGMVGAIFLTAILSVVFLSFQSSTRSREAFLVDSEALATLSNIQRHWLLLHVETRAWLDDPSIGTEEIENQRALLTAQLRVIKPYIENNLSVSRRIANIEASLIEYDALLAEAQASDDPQAYKAPLTELLQNEEAEQIKRAYDQVERGFFVTFSENLSAQQNIQSLLIILAVLFTIFIISAGIWAARTARITAELQQSQVTVLEQRVLDRTKALAASAEISRRLSTILQQDQLVHEVVEQVKDTFDYYHVHIYFFDDQKQNLVMAGGTGDAGKTMLAQGHKITRGRGLVGQAAETNTPVVVQETRKSPNWLPNPLLPETVAEIAIPISIGDKVLGVLDVQHNISNSLGQVDIDSLQSIANQVAIAAQNISQYENTQKIARDYKELVDSSPVAIAVLDADTGFFMDANQAAMNMYEITPEQLGKLGPIQLSPATQADGLPSQDKAVEMIKTAIESGRNTFEWTHQTLSGKEFLAEIRLALVSSSTEQKTLNAVMTNVTEQRRTQEADRQRARQQEALNLITQKIQSAASIEDAMKVATRELGHVLGMKPTAVMLHADAADTTKHNQ